MVRHSSRDKGKKERGTTAQESKVDINIHWRSPGGRRGLDSVHKDAFAAEMNPRKKLPWSNECGRHLITRSPCFRPRGMNLLYAFAYAGHEAKANCALLLSRNLGRVLDFNLISEIFRDR